MSGAGSAGGAPSASVEAGANVSRTQTNQTSKGFEQVSGSAKTMTDEERQLLSNLVMGLVGKDGGNNLGGLLNSLSAAGTSLQNNIAGILQAREAQARSLIGQQLEQNATAVANGTGSTFNTLMQAMQGRALSEAETQLQGQLAELGANLQQQAFQQQQQAAATTSDVLTQLLNVLQGASREYNQTTLSQNKTTGTSTTYGADVKGKLGT